MQADLVIQSDPNELRRARGWLSDHARASGFSDREVRDLALVVSEACANVIEHAYRGEPNHPIDLHLSIDDSRLLLLVHDLGVPFNVGEYRPPDLDVPQEGGYGVFIIRNLMDEVDYDVSEESGTTLRLVKYRQRRSPATPSRSRERLDP